MTYKTVRLTGSIFDAAGKQHQVNEVFDDRPRQDLRRSIETIASAVRSTTLRDDADEH